MMAGMKAASKDDDGYDGDADGPGSQDTLILGNSPDDRVNLLELSQLSGINILMGESGWFEEQNPEVVGFSLPPRHGLEGINAGIMAKEWIGSEGVEAVLEHVRQRAALHSQPRQSRGGGLIAALLAVALLAVGRGWVYPLVLYPLVCVRYPLDEKISTPRLGAF